MFEKKNVPSFEGTGKVVVQYHKFTENTSNNVMHELLLKAIKLSADIKDLVTLKNYNEVPFESLKKAAKNLGLINDAGDILELTPKTIIIKNGNDVIPDSFHADKIVQKGGNINGILSGGDIYVSGGSNKGINATLNYRQFGKFHPQVDGKTQAWNLYSHGAKLQNEIDTHNAYLYDNTEVSGKIKCAHFDTFDNTKILKTAKIESRDTVNLGDNTEVFGKINSRNLLDTKGDTKIQKGASLTADRIRLGGNTEVGGKISGKIDFIDKNVKITRTAKFDKTARQSLPSSRKFNFNFNKILTYKSLFKI